MERLYRSKCPAAQLAWLPISVSADIKTCGLNTPFKVHDLSNSLRIDVCAPVQQTNHGHQSGALVLLEHRGVFRIDCNGRMGCHS